MSGERGLLPLLPTRSSSTLPAPCSDTSADHPGLHYVRVGSPSRALRDRAPSGIATVDRLRDERSAGRADRSDHRGHPGSRSGDRSRLSAKREQPVYASAGAIADALETRRGASCASAAGVGAAGARPRWPTCPRSQTSIGWWRPRCGPGRGHDPRLQRRRVRTEGADRPRRLGEWVRAVEINLFGSVLPARALVGHFTERGYGKIVQLSGGGATNPLPGLSAYAASKAAVVRFAETLAGELREHHVDVNAIAPGALNTRMLDEVLAAGPEAVGQAFLRARARAAALRRCAAADEAPSSRCSSARRPATESPASCSARCGTRGRELPEHREDLDVRRLHAAADRAGGPRAGLG